MKIKLSEATPLQINWLVSKCEVGEPVGSFLDGVVVHPDYNKFYPSRNWAQGGPIIERERIRLDCWDFHSMPWKAAMWWDDERSSGDIQMYGPTPLIAAMRCYVASKLGDEVEVPDELKGE